MEFELAISVFELRNHNVTLKRDKCRSKIKHNDKRKYTSRITYNDEC